MSEPWLNLAVVCPECRKQERFALPLGAVAEALLKGSSIELYVSCHDIYWNADPSEIEQIRATLSDVAGVSIQRVAPFVPQELPQAAAAPTVVERPPATDQLGA